MLRHLPWLSWAILIFYLSVLPRTKLPEVDFNSADKIAHFIVYGILVALASYGGKQAITAETAHNYLLKIALYCFLYSFMIELIQGFLVAQRYFDIFDLLANGLGCIAGMAGFKHFMAIKN